MNVLVFAPHPDDEVLGVGGTIAKLTSKNIKVYVCIVTITNDEVLKKTILKEAKEANEILGVSDLIFLNLPVVELCDIKKQKIISSVREVVNKIKPEIVFLPHFGDMHTDHYEVTDSVMVTLRPVENPQIKQIYIYETLSETEWNIPTVSNAFIPNAWIDISESIKTKLNAMKKYESQLKKFPHPRSLIAIESLSKVRGSTISVNNAEAFYTVRNILEY